jgi:hypothetical protein
VTTGKDKKPEQVVEAKEDTMDLDKERLKLEKKEATEKTERLKIEMGQLRDVVSRSAGEKYSAALRDDISAFKNAYRTELEADIVMHEHKIEILTLEERFDIQESKEEFKQTRNTGTEKAVFISNELNSLRENLEFIKKLLAGLEDEDTLKSRLARVKDDLNQGQGLNTNPGGYFSGGINRIKDHKILKPNELARALVTDFDKNFNYYMESGFPSTALPSTRDLLKAVHGVATDAINAGDTETLAIAISLSEAVGETPRDLIEKISRLPEQAKTEFAQRYGTEKIYRRKYKEIVDRASRK